MRPDVVVGVLEVVDEGIEAENTVKHQLTPLFRKLGVRNRTEAALLARERTGMSAA